MLHKFGGAAVPSLILQKVDRQYVKIAPAKGTAPKFTG
jgi:hypothetical protein